MARMSREFSLVLLGAGLLTAGYFLWPEEDPIRQERDLLQREAEKNGGGRTRSGSRLVYFHIIPIPGRALGSSPALSTTYRGGVGGSGRITVGG